MRVLALVFAGLLGANLAHAQEREREVIPLSPEQAVEAGVRLGIDPHKERQGRQIYLVGVDAKVRSRQKTFDGFRIVIQKPRSEDAELTARMWSQEWPEDVFYTSFEIEESFLPYLYILIDYGKARYEGAYTYKVPVLPYLTRRPDNLPEGLKKMMAENAQTNEEGGA